MRSHVSLVVFFRWLVPLMLFVSCLAAWSAAEKPARPNVLFIAVDDLNHWGCGNYLPKDSTPPAKATGASDTGAESKKKNRKKNRDQ